MGDFTPDGLDSRGLQTLWEWKNRRVIITLPREPLATVSSLPWSYEQPRNDPEGPWHPRSQEGPVELEDHGPLLYLTLLSFASLYPTLLHFTLPYFTSLCPTLLHVDPASSHVKSSSNTNLKNR